MCDIDDFLLLISFQLFEIFREKKSILRLNSEELGGYEQNLKSNSIYNQRTFFFFEKLFSFEMSIKYCPFRSCRFSLKIFFSL